VLRGRQGFIRMASVAALGATCLAATACSGPPDPLAGLTGKQVLAEALANFKAAPRLTIDGMISEPGGSDSVPATPSVTLDAVAREPDVNLTMHIGIVPGKGCTGTVETFAKGSVTFIATGDAVYLKPDSTWWGTVAGSGGTGVSQLLNDRYLKESTTGGESVADACDVTQMPGLGSMTGTVTKGQVTTLNGVQVLPLDGAHDDVTYVTDTTKPEIAGLFQPKPDSDGDYGSLTVKVGAPVTLTAPSPGQAVDASDFGFTTGAGGATELSEGLGATLMTDALANTRAASSVTMSGTLSSSGQDYTLDLGLKPGEGGCTGTVETGATGGYKLVVVDQTVYFAPDTTFWEAYGGANAAAAINLVNGRYLEGPESDSNFGSIAALCDLSTVLATPKPLGNITMGQVTTLDGVRVLPLTDSDGGVMYVSDTGKLEVVEMTQDKAKATSASGTLTFKVGAPVTLTAPPPSEVLEGSTLGL
jgi:hypothetical protein